MIYSVKQIIEAVNGKLMKGDSNIYIKGISTDTRRIKKDDLFIAIKGKTLDGHKFIHEAVKKGASAVLSSKKTKVASNVPVILVKDTTKALGLLALYHRTNFNIPIIAVTGSAGKTTTKEMIAALLNSRFKVLKNFKTENNQYGVPYTLLKLDKSYDIGVIEMGTNRPGDIEWLSQIVRPEISVFTNIGDSHLERLKNRNGVFKEKISLIKFMPKNSYIICNNDDKYLRRITYRENGFKRISYSINKKSEIQATDIKSKNNFIGFKVKGKNYELKTISRHNLYNALAAISCAEILKIPYKKIYSGLKTNNIFSDGRQKVINKGKITIIDDTYNSNPASFKSALETLNGYYSKGKRICVCADMLELGKSSKSLHENIGEIIAKSNIDFVFAFGKSAKNIYLKIRKLNKEKKVFHFNNIEILKKELKKILSKNDVILVKGSRGMKMERIVEFLEANSKVLINKKTRL